MFYNPYLPRGKTTHKEESVACMNPEIYREIKRRILFTAGILIIYRLGGHLDYLTLDYLAEVTMSIMQKLKSRKPDAGYATDFVRMLDRQVFHIFAYYAWAVGGLFLWWSLRGTT